MKSMKYRHGVLLAGLLLVAPLVAQAEVNIFACEPEWAALAEEVGGDMVVAFAATHARQDPHYIRARPSLIAKVRNADLIFCSGAGLEVGWLPLLLQKAGSAVQPGKPGHLLAAEFVPLLEKHAAVDRSMGDIHPEGNPHVHLDPHNILLLAHELSRRLQAIDGANAASYHERLQDFSDRWQQAMARWQKEAADLQGLAVVVHHKSLSYMLAWLQLTEVGALEPKPGLPPSTAHLERLLLKLKATPATMILRTPYDPGDASEWLSAKTDTPAVVLPYTIGGDVASNDLFALYDRSINLLQKAAHARQ